MTFVSALVIVHAGLPPLAAQKPATELWVHDSDDTGPQDTVFTLPYGVAAHARLGLVFIADIRLPGIVVLDGQTGRMLRILGRRGSGPGEFSAPSHVAISPDGNLLAVSDLARRTVDVLTIDGRSLKRIPIGGFVFLKGLAIGNDTTLLMSGGRATGHLITSMTWYDGGAIVGTGPVPTGATPPDSMMARQAILYASGGPVELVGDRALLAETSTGDIFEATRSGARKVADGVLGLPDLLLKMIQPTPGTGSGPSRAGAIRPSTIWFGFPRPLIVESAPQGRYLTLYSAPDSAIVRLYSHGPRGSPRLIGAWSVNASMAARYDADSFITVGTKKGGFRIARVRLPAVNP